MTHDNAEPFTSPLPGAGQAQRCGLARLSLVGGMECNWWTVGRMMWQKVASKTEEEEDDRMKGGERSARAGWCDERRAWPRGGV